MAINAGKPVFSRTTFAWWRDGIYQRVRVGADAGKACIPGSGGVCEINPGDGLASTETCEKMLRKHSRVTEQVHKTEVPVSEFLTPSEPCLDRCFVVREKEALNLSPTVSGAGKVPTIIRGGGLWERIVCFIFIYAFDCLSYRFATSVSASSTVTQTQDLLLPATIVSKPRKMSLAANTAGIVGCSGLDADSQCQETIFIDDLAGKHLYIQIC